MICSVVFRRWVLFGLSLTAGLTFCGIRLPAAESTPAPRPNIVVIMTDNHGAWTLGCYGNTEIRTPHIDRLADSGVLFEQAFASNPVCSPTRATFLTGLMPSQHGVHSFLGGGNLQIGPDARSTLDEFVSLPEILNHAGYSCGLVGKWHLGDNLHPQEGFGDYWITMPHGGTATFYGADIVENSTIRQEPTYLTDFWTEHAERFIDQTQQQAAEKPFFLFLAYNGPYALGRLLLNEGQNRHAAYYADKELSSFPREPAHPWQFNNLDYHNNPVSIRRVATEVSGVDDGVGRILAKLDQHQLTDDTLIIFVADQGWVGGQGGFFGMGDHTRPVTARDGMMQIPMIWSLPGTIAAGKRTSALVTNYDVLPTLLSLLQMKYDPRLNTGGKPALTPELPGQDFTPLLTSDQKSTEAEPVFYEYEFLRCIRTANWKYVKRHPRGPDELFDLASDPHERVNLIDRPEYAEIQADLLAQLQTHFSKYRVAKYDLWQGGTSQTKLLVEVTESHSAARDLAELEETAQTPARAARWTPEFTPVDLTVPAGIEVSVAAGPPLVEHPMMACLDPTGRLYVCENAGVNMTAAELEANLPNSIRRLEDRNGDGVFDHATVFADQMTFPMGACWIDGSLFVASPPHIWKLTDTNDDGVADERIPLVSKFGYTGNAASIHGCFAGPDGRVYWCDGYHGHEIDDAAGNRVSQRFGSYLFSCRTDGSDVRIHSGGGMDNPVEIDFMPTGDLIGTVNIMYTRPRVDCLVHWQYGGAYPHREKVLDELATTGEFLGPIHRFGHVAISGTTRYRSGILDHHWRDNYFATFFNLGKVVRLELRPSGSTYSVTQREFLSSTNRDFHPTDVLEDVDGSLLVLDTGGWFYRGCPTSQIAKPDIPGAIYRIRKQGMPTPVDPGGREITWSQLTPPELAALMNDPREAVREQATRTAASRGNEMLPYLQSLLKVGDIRPRLHSVWAIAQMLQADRVPSAKSEAESDGTVPAVSALHRRAYEALLSALTDRHADVRQAACFVLLYAPHPQAASHLNSLLSDPHPAVRRTAAAALGRSGDRASTPALLAALANVADRYEEHAVIYALLELGDEAAVRSGLKAAAAETRRGGMLALDQMPARSLTAADVLLGLTDPSPAVQQEAVRLASRNRANPDFSASVTEFLVRESKRPDRNLSDNMLAALLASYSREPTVARTIGQILDSPTTATAVIENLARAIQLESGIVLDESWIPYLTRKLHSSDRQDIRQALELISAHPSPRLTPLLEQNAARDDLPRALKLQLLLAIPSAASAHNPAAFELLLEILDQPRDSAELAFAAQTVGNLNLNAAQLIELAGYLPQATSATLRELIRPYQRNQQPPVAQAFLEGLEQAKFLSTLPPQEISDIIKSYPDDLRTRANRLIDQLLKLEQEKLTVIDRMLPLLAAGDSERGRELFHSERSKCATCHQIRGQGKAVGPDLSGIGASRATRDLLESILFPSATIVRDYEAYTFVLSDGRVVTGMIARENGESLEIQQAAGNIEQVARADIDEMAPSNVSIMPSGLEKVFTEAELADLIAFLAAQKQSLATTERTTP